MRHVREMVATSVLPSSESEGGESGTALSGDGTEVSFAFNCQYENFCESGFVFPKGLMPVNGYISPTRELKNNEAVIVKERTRNAWAKKCPEEPFFLRRKPARSDDEDGGGELEEGAKVEARYKGGSRFYKGKITRVRMGGRAFDILYDDGEKEMGVKKENVRGRTEQPSGGGGMAVDLGEFDLLAFAEQQASFFWQVGSASFNSKDFLREGIDNYWQYLGLHNASEDDSDHDLAATYQIDLIWHSHLLAGIDTYTQDILQMCGQNANNHADTEGLDRAVAATTALWKQQHGTTRRDGINAMSTNGEAGFYRGEPPPDYFVTAPVAPVSLEINADPEFDSPHDWATRKAEEEAEKRKCRNCGCLCWVYTCMILKNCCHDDSAQHGLGGTPYQYN
jgi:hypothetical protein